MMAKNSKTTNPTVLDRALIQTELHVYKYPASGGSKPLLTVGEKFIPESDESHFCKPTDVAVEKMGSFYVADGISDILMMSYHLLMT
ncbi:hypothetical protein QZH41_007475 [Actinostola sp. cb2023]|nr:hypothetical protein QZH41_007475 [Actinostola sp. cb2023]